MLFQKPANQHNSRLQLLASAQVRAVRKGKNRCILLPPGSTDHQNVINDFVLAQALESTAEAGGQMSFSTQAKSGSGSKGGQAISGSSSLLCYYLRFGTGPNVRFPGCSHSQKVASRIGSGCRQNIEKCLQFADTLLPFCNLY